MKASFIFPPKKHAYFDLCKVPLFITFACSSPVLLFKRMFRPGGTPYNDLYGDAPPKRGPGDTPYNDLYREAPPERGPGGYSL